jgi:hypothetical protein
MTRTRHDMEFILTEKLDKNYTATAADTDLGAYIQARLDQWESTRKQAQDDLDKAAERKTYWTEQKRLFEAGELATE